MQQQLLYPITNITESIFAKHTLKSMWMNNSYVQLLYSAQSSSAVLTGAVNFENKFLIDYNVAASSNYYAIASQMGYVNENNWNLVPYQQFPGIWKAPSATGNNLASQQVAQRVQQIKISRYYYNDEIANGTFRAYYLPQISTASGSLSGLQNQNVLRFLDINKDFFGPTFTLSGDNLSATISAITVDMIFRPTQQTKSGYLWHRWTTDGNEIVQNYADAATASVSSYPYYANQQSYGIGCFVSHLTPVQDNDAPKPFIDFYVYGQYLNGTGHYLDLATGNINQTANTRFFLEQENLNTLFDGSFHNIRCIWSTESANSIGRIFIDGVELFGTSRGIGRTTNLNYSLTASPTSTPFYYCSQLDDPNQLGNNILSSKNTVFGETKHLLIYDKALTSNFVSASVSSNSALVSSIKSVTGNLCVWYAFNNTPIGYTAYDIASASATTHVLTSITASVTNDSVATHSNLPEGSINRIMGLIHDKSNQFWYSQYDSFDPNIQQRTVGKLFSSEYGNSEPVAIGAIFYDKGNALILNDHYNSDFQISTQLFVSASAGSFGVVGSSNTWPIQYLTLFGTQYVDRKVISLTANAEHFAKSRNDSSVFQDLNGNLYTKNNNKAMTGIIMFGKDNVPYIITKFSQPVYKTENQDVVFNINIDL